MEINWGSAIHVFRRVCLFGFQTLLKPKMPRSSSSFSRAAAKVANDSHRNATKEEGNKRAYVTLSCFNHLLVTILSLFVTFVVTFLPIPFCLPPFTSQWRILSRIFSYRNYFVILMALLAMYASISNDSNTRSQNLSSGIGIRSHSVTEILSPVVKQWSSKGSFLGKRFAGI